MAAKKYIALVTGRLKQIAAIVVSAGAGNDGDLVALDASGKLDASVLPAGIGANTVSVVASEALAANDLVNLWNNGGTINARKADATTEGKEVHGFVKAGFASSASATVYLSGNVITGLSGLTPGARQYLGKTAGARVEDVSAYTAGNVVQKIGDAASATSLVFEPEEPITVA
jgi:hypothetical protein